MDEQNDQTTPAADGQNDDAATEETTTPATEGEAAPTEETPAE